MKFGIVTIDDDNNYGNRLQNYALECFLRKNNFDVCTFRVNKFNIDFKRIVKTIINYKHQWNFELRYKKFKRFNNNINIVNVKSLSDKVVSDKDYIVVGSDQVWNPKFGHLSNKELLIDIAPEKRLSYAASFGINNLPDECHDRTRKELKLFKAISVREDRGKEIIFELTKRNDVSVLVDPTMLLSEEDWLKLVKRPKQLKKDKYILNYFLGDLSNDKREEIERIAKDNDCEIINILDKNSPFYNTGPSEFLYLEKNAFLICTDSFHSSVFGIIFNRPFIVFERDDKHIAKMNSRLDTLINKFNLKNRKYDGKITKKNLAHDYSDAYEILKEERKRSLQFIKNSIKKN